MGEQIQLGHDQQPTDKVELHAAAVIDADLVAPALGEVGAELRDPVGWQTWYRGMPLRRCLMDFVVKGLERRVTEA